MPLLAIFFSAIVFAENGQYRSKVLLSPTGEMAKGAELSVEELEQQINTIDEPYAKSSAGRHLARHYVENGEYAKAIQYYETALGARGLSDIANREMLRELAQVYLLMERYAEAATTLEKILAVDLVPASADFLMLARAQYKLNQYVAVVATLDSLLEKELLLNAVQLHQVLALYYGVGAYAQCEDILGKLLKLEPDNPENWHLLVSVYLQRGKRREALDRLVLARSKSVPFSERDILLLADLQGVANNPYGAAETLSRALAQRELKKTGEHYRKLFEFWLAAREVDRAQKALQQAAQLTGDTQLYLYLAQLQMEQQAWPAMKKTMLRACTEQLEDRFVSRANLLLGVSQLKLGDTVAARRSFINASLIGGANKQAGQWLAFMNAEPATREEARIIVGACYGSEDKRQLAKASATRLPEAVREPDTIVSQPEEAVQTKTVPAMRLFYSLVKEDISTVLGKMESSAMRLNLALVKAGGEAEGPVQLMFQRTGGRFKSIKISLPAKGLPTAKGKYKTGRAASYRCAYRNYTGELSELPAALSHFVATLEKQGESLSGEVRIVLHSVRGKGVELQLGLL